MRCLVIVGMLIFLVAATAVGAENLMTNPSAEESADNGMRSDRTRRRSRPRSPQHGSWEPKALSCFIVITCTTST